MASIVRGATSDEVASLCGYQLCIPEARPSVEIEESRDRWHWATRQVAQIGRGLARMPEGVTGRTLQHEDFWRECVMADHPFAGTRGATAVQYLGEEERRAYEVTFQAGRLVRLCPTRVLYQPLAGRPAICVVGPDKKIYAGTPVAGLFHHSSFLAGGAVIGAGGIHTDEEGLVGEISDRSGHYLPRVADTCAMLRVFAEHGLDLDRVAITTGAKQIRFASCTEYLEEAESTGREEDSTRHPIRYGRRDYASGGFVVPPLPPSLDHAWTSPF